MSNVSRGPIKSARFHKIDNSWKLSMSNGRKEESRRKKKGVKTAEKMVRVKCEEGEIIDVDERGLYSPPKRSFFVFTCSSMTDGR